MEGTEMVEIASLPTKQHEILNLLKRDLTENTLKKIRLRKHDKNLLNEWLHMAAFQCNMKACKFLIELGADVNYVSDDSSVIEMLLSLNNKTREIDEYKTIFDYLISKGADVNRRSPSGESCIDLIFELQEDLEEMDKAKEMVLHVINTKVLDLTAGVITKGSIVGLYPRTEEEKQRVKDFNLCPILYRACIDNLIWDIEVQSAIIQNSVNPDEEIKKLLSGQHELFHDKFGEDFLNDIYLEYQKEDDVSYPSCENALFELEHLYDRLQSSKKNKIDELGLGDDNPLSIAYQKDLANKNMISAWLMRLPVESTQLHAVSYGEPVGQFVDVLPTASARPALLPSRRYGGKRKTKRKTNKKMRKSKKSHKKKIGRRTKRLKK